MTKRISNAQKIVHKNVQKIVHKNYRNYRNVVSWTCTPIFVPSRVPKQ